MSTEGGGEGGRNKEEFNKIRLIMREDSKAGHCQNKSKEERVLEDRVGNGKFGTGDSMILDRRR
jgi:hypothetical protein